MRNWITCFLLSHGLGASIAFAAPTTWSKQLKSDPKILVSLSERNDPNLCKQHKDGEKVKYIELFGLDFPNLNFLRCFPALEVLNINNGKVAALEGTAFSKNLKILILRNNGIQDATPLHELEGLRELDLSYNHVNSFEGLDRLGSLEILDLSGNENDAEWSLNPPEKLRVLDLSFSRGPNLERENEGWNVYR